MSYADIAQQIMELALEKSRLQAENAVLKDQIVFLKKLVLEREKNMPESPQPEAA